VYLYIGQLEFLFCKQSAINRHDA